MLQEMSHSEPLILFIHGLASSGRYKMADMLRIQLKPCTVISPDVPVETELALPLLQEICRKQAPDLVVGLSLGGFWAQKLRGIRKALVNPDFYPSALLRGKIGEMKYLSPREDGAESFMITEKICRGYEEIENGCFEGLDAAEQALTTAFFASDDEMVRHGGIFARYYPLGRKIDYPGTHLPTFPAMKEFITPELKYLLKVQ